MEIVPIYSHDVRRVVRQESSMISCKENILAYIGGFVVRKIILEENNKNVYYLNLTKIKDNSGG